VEIEVETGAAQGGVDNNSSREVQAPTSSNQSQVEVNYSIARDRFKREIRKPARYVNSNGLVAYIFTVAEQIFEGAEPPTLY